MSRSSLFRATLLAVALLGFGPSSAAAVTRAQGTISAVSSEANTYLLTVENTGTDAIQCIRFFAASGVTMTSVTPPAEVESDSAFSAGPGLNLSPGGTSTFRFTTQAAYPTNGGGTLNVSSTCSAGSDVSSPVEGPAAAAPPPPDPACKCTGLTARLIDPTIHALHGRFLGFKVRWKLTCSAGAGVNCRGRIKLATFPRDVSFTRPRNKIVRCVGPCDATTTRRSNLRMLLSKRLRPLANAPVRLRRRHVNAYPPLRIGMTFFCLDAAGAETRVGRKVMTVRFDRYGQVDRRRSDLDG